MPRRSPGSRTCASWASPRRSARARPTARLPPTCWRQARQLADAGVSAAIDVTRNEVNLAAVRTQLVITRNQLARARLDLARALSLPPETPLALADSLGQEDQRLPTDQDSAVAFAKDHRPEVLAEQRRTEAVRLSADARSGRKTCRAPASPGQVQESGQQTDGLAGTWVVQVGVSIPIFDGLRRQKRRARAERPLRRAEAAGVRRDPAGGRRGTAGRARPHRRPGGTRRGASSGSASPTSSSSRRMSASRPASPAASRPPTRNATSWARATRSSRPGFPWTSPGSIHTARSASSCPRTASEVTVLAPRA